MSEPLVIAFGHRRKMGKDTCCQFIKKKYGDLVWRTSFAYHLKESAHNLFGWAGLWGYAYYERYPSAKEQILPKLGISPRDLWIAYGNKMRDIYPNIWVDIALNRDELSNVPVIVVSDERYPNEIERVKQYKNSLTVKVHRDGVPLHTDQADTALANYTGWDMVIDNSGSFDDLELKLKPIYDRIDTHVSART